MLPENQQTRGRPLMAWALAPPTIC